MSEPTKVIRLNGYLNMPKEALSPGNGLGMAARGLLATMLTKPEGWRFAADRLAEEVGESRYSVLQTLKKLREAGYVRTVDLRDAGSGNLSRVTWIRDSLQAPWPDAAEVRISDSGASEFGETVQIVSPVEVIPVEVKTLAQPARVPASDKAVEADESFARFWAGYPRKKEKKRARLAWKKLTREQREDAIASLPKFSNAMKGRAEQHIMQPPTFLNGESWNDYRGHEAQTAPAFSETKFMAEAFEAWVAARGGDDGWYEDGGGRNQALRKCVAAAKKARS